MKAHLFQLDPVWEDREANFKLVEQATATADISPGDLLVLPELFDSGFSLNVTRTADKDGGTLRFLLELADDLGVTIQGSRTVLACQCSQATNRATVVGPNDRLICDYSKIHPFTLGREPEAFLGGARVETYAWGNATVCPAICYDLRFPELFRLGLAAGAEVFAIGANWPAARHEHWRALAVARAIENQAFVLAVNRVGTDPHLEYLGGTLAIDSMGRTLGELGDDPGVLSVEIDTGSVRAWRSEFPAWRDMKLMPGAGSTPGGSPHAGEA
ncbi:MAG: nitrilase-related carbon-nitrogen hydrolase [Planctomycetota bacterium]